MVIIIYKWKNKYWLNDSYLISYYGHAWKTKWIDLLVEAIPQILKENPDAKLLFNIIPSKRSDDIVERINSISKQLKAENRIQIFRWFTKEELRIFVACADVIIAPSLAEWFGSVHSEACAMWKNLITSNIAAIPEVVSGDVILMSPPVQNESVNQSRKLEIEILIGFQRRSSVGVKWLIKWNVCIKYNNIEKTKYKHSTHRFYFTCNKFLW